MCRCCVVVGIPLGHDVIVIPVCLPAGMLLMLLLDAKLFFPQLFGELLLLL